MATDTKFVMKVTTNNDFVSNEVEEFIAFVNGLLPMLKAIGLGKRIGIQNLRIKLSDKDV